MIFFDHFWKWENIVSNHFPMIFPMVFLLKVVDLFSFFIQTLNKSTTFLKFKKKFLDFSNPL